MFKLKVAGTTLVVLLFLALGLEFVLGRSFKAHFKFSLPDSADDVVVHESAFFNSSLWISFSIDEDGLRKLSAAAEQAGFSKWLLVEGHGFCYGTFNLEVERSHDIHLSERGSTHGNHYMLFHHRKTGRVDAVAFFN